MSRSSEFGSFLQSREQGLRDIKSNLARARAFHDVSRISVSVVPVEDRSRHSNLSRLVLVTGTAGLAVFGLNFLVDRYSIAEAGDPSTATATSIDTRTSTSTPTPTRTPTSRANSGATVVISGEQGVNIQIDNSNTLNNPRHTDASRNSLPTPVATPTLKPFQDLIELNKARAELYGSDAVAEQMRLNDERAKKQVEDFLNPSPTPNATATWEAKSTYGARKLADDQASATAAVPAPIRTAQAKADKLAIDKQVAEMNLENKTTESQIETLKNPAPPSESRDGGFPWGWVTALAAAGLCSAGVFITAAGVAGIAAGATNRTRIIRVWRAIRPTRRHPRP